MNDMNMLAITLLLIAIGSTEAAIGLSLLIIIAWVNRSISLKLSCLNSLRTREAYCIT